MARGALATEKLHDLVTFTEHSFIPMMTELYTLKHNDISIQQFAEKDRRIRKMATLSSASMKRRTFLRFHLEPEDSRATKDRARKFA